MKRRGGWFVGALATLVLVQVAVNLVLDARSKRAGLRVRATLSGTPARTGDVGVRIHPAGRGDELAAEGDSHEWLDLAPGRYDVRVALAGAGDDVRWLRDVELQPGQRAVRDVAFEVGWLGVEADAPGDRAEVLGYVYETGSDPPLAAVIRPEREALLAPGTYDVRVVLLEGSEERDVTWLRGIEVGPGSRVRPAVAFRRGTLLVRAAAGGTALPRGAAELTIHREDDDQEEVLFEGLAGSPLSLPGGRYAVRVTYVDSDDRPEAWLRDVEVEDGETVERRVEFDSGNVLIEATLGGAHPLDDFDAYVYYYRDGHYREPVAYTPAGQPAILSAGKYDLRIHFFRSHDRPDVWLRGVAVAAGAAVTRRVDFDSGSVLIRAHDSSGAELIGDEVFVRIHAHGERSRPIAVARSGEALVLSAGRYDLGIEDARRPGPLRWLSDIEIRTGQRDEVRVDLP